MAIIKYHGGNPLYEWDEKSRVLYEYGRAPLYDFDGHLLKEHAGNPLYYWEAPYLKTTMGKILLKWQNNAIVNNSNGEILYDWTGYGLQKHGREIEYDVEGRMPIAIIMAIILRQNNKKEDY